MLLNALVLALRAIRRNVMRSSLTILGIVIGVAAVIIMVTVGAGATAQVTENISSLGTNLLMVTPGRRMGPESGSTQVPFKVADAEAIAREVPSATAVVAMSSKSLSAIYGNENWQTSVTGSDNGYFIVRSWSLAAGRQFNESELRGGKAVCVLGATVRKKLFGAQDPIGESIRLEAFSCQVIGLLEEKGQNTMGNDQDDVVVLPLRTFQRRVAGRQDVSLIQVKVRDGVSTERVQRNIETLLRERRHISANEEDDFQVMDMKELGRMLTGTTQTLTTLLAMVAAVSLLVGGIGIMNIMLVSVTERTREIGIRLAIGALEYEVLSQFLVEAVVLSSFGGLVGIVAALVTSVVLARVLSFPFVFNPGIVALAFVFSAAVGMIFGFFPARKAARLDPIDALRHE